MEKKEKSKTGIIIFLILIIIGLIGYIGYDKFILKAENKIEETNKEDIKQCEEKEEEKEEETIEYVFDVNNIYNRREDYGYVVVDSNDSEFFYPKQIRDTETGIIVEDNSKNISYKINNKYKYYIETTMHHGDPGMDGYRTILLNEDGTVDYLKYDRAAQEKIELYRINNLKDVVKLYPTYYGYIKNEFYAGQTVVAQTKDGKLYDLYDYVFTDTTLFGDSYNNYSRYQ